MASLHYVCESSELAPGERKIITVGKRSIGIFNIKGEFFALLNVCPHQFAPLCLGRVTGYSPPSAVGEFNYCREGEIIRCPWHGWEFDIKTGKSVFNPHRVKTASYPVKVMSQSGDTSADEDEEVETFPVELTQGKIYVEA